MVKERTKSVCESFVILHPSSTLVSDLSQSSEIPVWEASLKQISETKVSPPHTRTQITFTTAHISKKTSRTARARERRFLSALEEVLLKTPTISPMTPKPKMLLMIYGAPLAPRTRTGPFHVHLTMPWWMVSILISRQGQPRETTAQSTLHLRKSSETNSKHLVILSS